MEREELHRRINLLQEKLKEGNIEFAPHLIEEFQQSMKKVRNLSDGMVDPDTVDGRIRALCNIISYDDERQKWKEAASLKEIQDAFFQRVDCFFGNFFENMTKENANPYEFSDWLSSDKNRVKKLIPVIDSFLEEINKFWEGVSYTTWIHLEDSDASKAVFTGELFPNDGSNITSSIGIYFDTIILPDPFLKIFHLVKLMDDKDKCYRIVYLALQVLSYKSLAVEAENPIVLILPDKHHIEDEYRKFVHQIAVNNSIEHTKTLFGQDVENEKELSKYYSHFKDGDEIVSKLRKPDKLVIDTDWDDPLPAQLMRLIELHNLKKIGIKSAGQAVLGHLMGRFSQANDAFQRSCQLRGTPIICAETSWIWYNQMLELNAKNSGQNSSNDFHIARALNSTVKNEMPWIGNIPPDALIEMRQTGALDEIRHVLSSGIKDIVDANPSDFNKTGDKVFNNLDAAFKTHEKKIKNLISKRWSFAGKDLGSFVVVGGIEITAALTGLPIWGVATGVAGMSGAVPSVKELKDKYKQLKAEESKINNTGIGILFKHKK